MTVSLERGGRELAPAAVAALAAWAPRSAAATTLHAGDVGWHLRLDDADLDGTILLARDRSDVVAVALAESAALRVTVRADRGDDRHVATAVGAVALSMAESRGDPETTSEVYCDASAHLALRALLVGAGWSPDPDAWTVFYRPLSADDASLGDGLASQVTSEDDVRGRVEVQFNAFDHSTFTVARWHQMAAGPGYRRELDVLRRDDEGVPVAAATAWMAAPERVGILEPVGTHRVHVGRGHGRAVTLAAIGALARAGASGVAVQTPRSNVAAVRTYEHCGLRAIDHLHALRYPSPHS